MHAKCLDLFRASLQAPEGIDIDGGGLPAGDIGGHQGQPTRGRVGGDLDLKIACLDVGAHLGVEVALRVEKSVDRGRLQPADDGTFDVGREFLQGRLGCHHRCFVVVLCVGVGLIARRVERIATESRVDRDVAKLRRCGTQGQQRQSEQCHAHGARKDCFHNELYVQVLAITNPIGPNQDL